MKTEKEIRHELKVLQKAKRKLEKRANEDINEELMRVTCMIYDEITADIKLLKWVLED